MERGRPRPHGNCYRQAPALVQSGACGRGRPRSIKCQPTCKPGSVSCRSQDDDHSSGPCVAAWFSRPTRMHAHGRARTPFGAAASLFGLAPGGACRATFLTVGAVGSYPTVSALPVLTRVSHRRSILCCTIPRIASGGRYPPPYPRGARTFLDALAHPAAVQPTGRATVCSLQLAR